MTAPTDEEVAAGLSEAQKRVLRDMIVATDPLRTFKALARKELMRFRGFGQGGRGYEITETGLRIRAILERQNP